MKLAIEILTGVTSVLIVWVVAWLIYTAIYERGQKKCHRCKYRDAEDARIEQDKLLRWRIRNEIVDMKDEEALRKKVGKKCN